MEQTLGAKLNAFARCIHAIHRLKNKSIRLAFFRLFLFARPPVSGIGHTGQVITKCADGYA